jgi:hypothetical protein
MLTPLALEHAHAVIRDRLQQAARDALADQLRPAPAARPARDGRRLLAVAAPRHWLALGLRGLASRLDPCVSADTPLVVLKAR